MSIVIKNVRIIDGNGSCIENGYIVFDENGIEIPFEQVVVHNGNDHN